MRPHRRGQFQHSRVVLDASARSWLSRRDCSRWPGRVRSTRVRAGPDSPRCDDAGHGRARVSGPVARPCGPPTHARSRHDCRSRLHGARWRAGRDEETVRVRDTLSARRGTASGRLTDPRSPLLRRGSRDRGAHHPVPAALRRARPSPRGRSIQSCGWVPTPGMTQQGT